MNITILAVTPTPATTKTGKPYTVLDVAFKNNTFQGKVEGKKIMPFGENANSFKTLEKAQPGQSFDITVVKNAAGYNDWVAVVEAGAAPQPAQQGASYAPKAAPSSPQRTSTYETPEERAAKQVYIVRQSSLTAAINTLSVGAKALKSADVIALAKEYEAFVFDKGAAQGGAAVIDASGFDNIDEDIPL